MKPEFDAYEEMLKLIDFAHRADTHLTNLLNNERHIVDSINDISKRLHDLETRIELLEDILQGDSYEITGTK